MPLVEVESNFTLRHGSSVCEMTNNDRQVYMSTHRQVLANVLNLGTTRSRRRAKTSCLLSMVASFIRNYSPSRHAVRWSSQSCEMAIHCLMSGRVPYEQPYLFFRLFFNYVYYVVTWTIIIIINTYDAYYQ